MRRRNPGKLRRSGKTAEEWLREVLALVAQNRSWRAHPEPFSKTCRGRARRQARLAARALFHAEGAPVDLWPADALGPAPTETLFPAPTPRTPSHLRHYEPDRQI